MSDITLKLQSSAKKLIAEVMAATVKAERAARRTIEALKAEVAQLTAENLALREQVAEDEAFLSELVDEMDGTTADSGDASGASMGGIERGTPVAE